MTETVLWWLRRDLRLEDNPALRQALNGERRVVPVFILDPYLLARPAEKRQSFLFAGLRALDADLRARGSRLVVRQGPPLEVLTQLTAESGAGAVYAEEDVSPYARRRDAQVAAALTLRSVTGATVFPAAQVRKADGSPYTVFTPYSKAWKALPFPGAPQPAPARLPAVPDALTSLPIPPTPAPAEFPVGEAEAERRLQAFLDGRMAAYAEQRDRMDLEGTSALSPYLRFGMLSARKAAWAALEAARLAPDPQARRGAETWLNELIWREFYHAILYAFPFVLHTAFNASLRGVPWRNAPAELEAWRAGRTGYPVVDAAMRQLAATGWMHNRARMIVASFLTKDLLINWQAGERWFMHTLVDGDPAANNGGWQWAAGTGTDAAPYFRIFNPSLQSAKFDPQGVYIRRWLPELARASLDGLHDPNRLTPAERRAANYPTPIVDHAAARERALRLYRPA